MAKHSKDGSESKSMHFKVNSLTAFSDLVRLEHGIMYGIGVFIGAILSGWTPSGWSVNMPVTLLIGFVVALLSEFGAFALNDYFDIAADKVNKRIDRPIIRKEISPDAALLIGLVSFVLANIFAFIYLNHTAFIVIFALTALSIIYNMALKHLPLIGNLFIAITMAVPFLFGGLLFGNIGAAALYLSLIAFFVGIGREVMKDIEDMPGDRKAGAKTLPLSIGIRYSILVVLSCYLLSIALSIIPFFTFFRNKPAYELVLVTDAILVYVSSVLWNDHSLKALRSGRKWTLYAVAIGLVAFLIASL